VTVHKGVPITTVPRTLLDLAEVVPRRQLKAAIETADRRGLFDGRAVEELLARSPGRHVCVERELPVPTMNVPILGYTVDAHWPGTNLIVELDSRAFHLNAKAFEEDRKRDAALMLAGYRVLRVTCRQLTREPDQLARTLSRLLAYPRPAPPSPHFAAPSRAEALQP